MLVSFAKSVGRKSVSVQKPQIKKRGYSTVLRNVNEQVAVLDSTVLDSVLANKEGHKSLAQAYKDALLSQRAARQEIIDSVQKELSASPFATVRGAAESLVAALNHANSEVENDAVKFSIPLTNIDEVLEVHEVAELTNNYLKGFAQLPHVPTKTDVPVDAITDIFAGAVRFSLSPFCSPIALNSPILDTDQ